VADVVLNDSLAPREVRKRRVEALKVMGQIFQSVKADPDSSPKPDLFAGVAGAGAAGR
jgi:hypothetical protein